MNYTREEIQKHLEGEWQVEGTILEIGYGPKEKLHPDFRVIEFPPGPKHNFWIYSTAGMSIDREDGRNIELHIFSSKQDKDLLVILASAASFHRNLEPLGLNHTVNFGQPWQYNSKCDHGFISLPYLDGEKLEIFENQYSHLHNLWLIPITEAERDYKISHGSEKLEDLFESEKLDYLNPSRTSLL